MHHNDQSLPILAFLIRGDESYGVRSGTLALQEGLRRLGWRTPTVAFQAGRTAQACADAGAELHVLGEEIPDRPEGVWPKFRRFLANSSQARVVGRRVAALLRDLNAAGLHLRWPSLVTVAGEAARGAGIPGFWHLPNTIQNEGPLGLSLPALFYQWQCRKYGILPLANSRATAETLGDRWVKPEVLYLGADARRFDPARLEPLDRASFGIGGDAMVLGVFARMIPGKGQSHVLRAMLSITDAGCPLHLLLVGGPVDGEYAQRLAALAAKAGAADRLHIVGHVSDPERYYSVVDVAVNAYIGIESFGISVIEAMLMGTPVLAFAAGGPGETILDGETGWHVAEQSVESLEAGIRRALDDRGRWPAMGQAARQHALQRFSQEAYTDGFVRIVQPILGNRASRESVA